MKNGHQKCAHPVRRTTTKVCPNLMNVGINYITVIAVNTAIISFILIKLGSCWLNLSLFWAVNNLTKSLKNQKSFCDSVFHVNDHPQIKFQYLLSSQSWDNEASSAPILGWGINLSCFGHLVPCCTYCLQIFLGYEAGTKNVRRDRGSYRSPTWFLME